MAARSAPPPAPSRLGHRPALDGVRGVAWVVVFAAHAWVIPHLAIGQPAMFVFFALSGFLITVLLLEERSATGRVSLRNFFVRRSLRLLPALLLLLAVWLVVVLATAGHAPWTTFVPGGYAATGTPPLAALEGVGGALGYATNWLEIFHGYAGYFPLGHLWSLAVEEQFYVLWAPLLVVALWWKGRRAALVVALGLAAASLADAVALNRPVLSLVLEMSTQARAGTFLVGAALGIVWVRRPPLLDRHLRRLRPLLLAAGAAPLAWSAWVFSNPVVPRIFDAAWVAVSVGSGLLVLALVTPRSSSAPGLLDGRVLTYLGRRSYALYLWHYLWLTWFHALGLGGIVLALGASLASAELSWQLVERRALALKGRFSARPAGATPARLVPEPALEEGHDVVPELAGAR